MFDHTHLPSSVVINIPKTIIQNVFSNIFMINRFFSFIDTQHTKKHAQKLKIKRENTSDYRSTIMIVFE